MKPLRALVLEDSPDDTELVLAELAKGGYVVESERVQTAEQMRAAIKSKPWDVVLADHGMPSFSVADALGVLSHERLDVPLVVVSGTIGEEAAVAAMRAGARDVVLKSRMYRLAPAIERELGAAEARAARRKAEEDLFAVELRYRRLFESGMTGIVVFDADHHVIEANDAFLRTFGADRDDLERGALVFPDDAVKTWTTAASGRPADLLLGGLGAPVEARLERRDGTMADVLLAIAALDGPLSIAVVIDTSTQKRLEDQLRQVQKMDAIGALVAGISHDFNNILSVILSYAESILMELPPAEPLREDIEEIRRAGERAADLTRKLLTFSRQQVMVPRSIDLGHVVLDMEPMLRRVITETIELSIVGSRGSHVHADPSQMEQIVMNLVANARDAMPNGGEVTIEIAPAVLDAAYCASHVGVRPGDYVMLAVSDNGTGMDAATRARIFEPFFTTKEKGRGTGLGMATVFGIVGQNGGHIWVESAPGRGTTVRVYLPREASAPLESEALESVAPATLSGSETILLVEDDDQVRQIVRKLLRRRGYLVLEARNGAEALIVSEKHPGHIHLIITDVVMPYMGGRELVDRLSVQRPKTRALFLSGYAENVVTHQGALDPGVEFLPKPVPTELLLRKVREMLEPPSGSRG